MMTTKKDQQNKIVVTGVGMVTSVGHSAWSSAAAIRAGIVRVQDHGQAVVATDKDGVDFEPAVVAQVRLIDETLTGIERAVALVAPALRECLKQSGLPINLLRKGEWTVDNFIMDDPPHAHTARPDFYTGLNQEMEGVTIPFSAIKPSGDLRFTFERVMQAAERLRAGKQDFALVGAVDSLSTFPAIGRLEDEGSLKAGNRPDGILPGEAAGLFLLETEAHARKRNASILAYVESWGKGMEPHPWSGSTPSRAEGLTAAIRQALEGVEGRGANVGLVLADLNGDRQRALEWALAEPRVFPFEHSHRRLWHPADCIGDCGAAMGAVLVIIGAIALAKGYAKTEQVLLTTSDDGGARYVLSLKKGDALNSQALYHLALSGTRR